MEQVVYEFLAFVTTEKALSPHTRLAYEKDIQQYFEFCRRKKLSPLHVQLRQVRQYLASLRRAGLANRSIARKLSSVKQFYKFLLREERISSDPVELLTVTVKARKLPACLTVEEMAALIEAATGTNEVETRDRAMLELWYATGARISEMMNLRIQDIDWKGGVVKFLGKGGRERLVPVHPGALDWCSKYRDIRHRWLSEYALAETQRFFLSRLGKGFTRQGIWKIVRKYARKAHLGKRVWPHMIRHTFATHVLRGGADLRAVQELLGHRSISTTEIYTHLDTENLKIMQLKYHPRS